MRIEEMIGARIREARERAGITQRRLAELLGELLSREWTRQAVSLAEKGGRALTAAEVVAFAVVLDAPVVTLLAPMASVQYIELPGGRVDVDRVLLGLPPKPHDVVSDPLAQALDGLSKLVERHGEVGGHLADVHSALVSLAQMRSAM